MKVVTPKEMARIESMGYKAGCKEDQFMEKAGLGIAHIVDSYIQKHALGEQVSLLCGKGNNSGDAYVAGIELLSHGYEVFAIQVIKLSECSPLCQKYAKLFLNTGGKIKDEFEELPKRSVLLDGLFGTGFHGVAGDPFASLIQKANSSKQPIISIDIPSGLNGETGSADGPAIIAHATVFLGLPKKGFFLNEGWNHVGELFSVNFGLPQQLIDEANFDVAMLNISTLKLPKIVRNRHKYQAGHVVGLGGSPGMPGAALMASFAALRAGAGMVHLLHPKEMDLGPIPNELIKFVYETEKIEEIISHLNQGDAVFIGPAMGRTGKAHQLLREVLPRIDKPTVIDADALSILSQEEIPLPKQSILTPHSGEMARLLHLESHLSLNDQLLKQCQEFAEKRKVTLVLKGGPTFIFQPGNTPSVCSRGTPGLATAGSGDILTGMIASLLAQGLSLKDAAETGVYLHASAGEEAANIWTPYCMIATDILDVLPQAYRELLP